MKRIFVLVLFCILCRPYSLQAAEEVLSGPLYQEMKQLHHLVTELKSHVQELGKTVSDQNRIIRDQAERIQRLEGQKTTGRDVRAGSAKLPLRGLTQGFNPDIGLTGTVQAQLTESGEDEEGKDTIALKELELSIAQYVDPYSRLDAVIAFNDNLEDQNVDIEEAYYSHWGLPWGFQTRLGKFRAKAGKANLLHLHQLDTVDYPLVIRDFFGEEGMSSSGLRLSNMIPNPWDIPLELTGEIFRGNNGASFSGISRRPVFSTHLQSFFEVNPSLNIELGSTVMFGDRNIEGSPKGDDRFGVHLFGWDMTWTWLLDEGRSVKWLSELYYQNRSAVSGENNHPWGFYSLLDVKLTPKWSAGIRFDYLEPLGANTVHGQTVSVSPYLTFWQSEFAHFRLQYTHEEPAALDGETDDMLFLQANFLIGSHQHPVQ